MNEFIELPKIYPGVSNIVEARKKAVQPQDEAIEKTPDKEPDDKEKKGPLSLSREYLAEVLKESGFVDVNTPISKRMKIYLGLDDNGNTDDEDNSDPNSATETAASSANKIAANAEAALAMQGNVQPDVAVKLLN
jgi:hypothetical protein